MDGWLRRAVPRRGGNAAPFQPGALGLAPADPRCRHDDARVGAQQSQAERRPCRPMPWLSPGSRRMAEQGEGRAGQSGGLPAPACLPAMHSGLLRVLLLELKWYRTK